MAIEFRKEVSHSRILDPNKNFEETSLRFERRFDPLTQRCIGVFDSPFRNYRPTKPDLSGVIQRSLELGCPFCPDRIEKVTPKYPPDILPEGRLSIGEIRVFPNALNFAPYSGIVVLAAQHFIGIDEFTEEIIAGGFQACQMFLNRIASHDPQVKYLTINWNYLPPAGGSVIHPHLQPAADFFPTNHMREMMEASQRYYMENSSNFWPELIAREKELGERYVGATGAVSWITSFVPRGRYLDVMAILEGGETILTVPQEQWQDFARGLKRVLNYLGELGFYSFNLTMFSVVKREDYFWTHARILPRGPMPPLEVSDCSYLELFHGQVSTAKPPEDTCQELREYFA
ncbi:MAG: hypothetical protein ACE5IA_02525 [Dehalococcoidia bacterium]